jgi:hypothetical protein
MLNVSFTVFHPLNLFPHKHHPSSPNSYTHHSPQIEYPPSKEEKTLKIKIQHHTTLVASNKPNTHNRFDAMFAIANSHLQQ